MPVLTRSQSMKLKQTQVVEKTQVPTPNIQMTVTQMLSKRKNNHKKDAINKKEQEKKARLEVQRIYRENWISERKIAWEKYRNSPICQYIRKMKLNESDETVSSVLFYLGEIKGPQLSYNWALGDLNKKNKNSLMMTIKALKVACPKINIKITTDFENYGEPCSSTYSELDISWNEGDMSQVVLNEYIFPDYGFVEESTFDMV